MKSKTRIRLRLFSAKVIGVVMIIIMTIVSLLLHRPIEMLSITIFFYIYRSLYTKQYHSDSILLCGIITIVVFTVIALASLELSVSILISCISTFILTSCSYHYRDYLDIKAMKNNQVPYRQKVIKALGNNLSESYIYEYCTKLGFYDDYIAETIHLFLNNKVEVVAEVLNIEVSTVYRRIKKFLNHTENLQFC